jgi:hypothetical protein
MTLVSTIDRISRHIVVSPTGCWEWQRRRDKDGYGQINLNGRVTQAHRASYEAHVAKIPIGMVIDRLCRNTRCVNPDHLEVVSRRVNTLRGNGVTAMHSRKTHCIKGHELSGNNVYLWRGGRQCRECNRIYKSLKKVGK